MSAAAAWALEVDAQWADELGGVRDALEYVGLQAIRHIDLRSPVDNGRFRGNWTLTIGEPSGAVLDITDKSGANTVARNSSVLSEYPQDTFPTIYLQNNLPYAEPLESGHSKQAPSGMVAITTAELAALWEIGRAHV